MSGIVIRPVREEDARPLLEIENAIWTWQNSPDVRHRDDAKTYWERMRDTPTLVAEVSGNVVGFICYSPPTPLNAHRYQWEIALGIDPGWQGKGIGGQLMDAVKRLAREAGIRKISLRVLESNAGAIRFYKKHGFVQEGYLRDEFFIENAFRGDCLFAYFCD